MECCRGFHHVQSSRRRLTMCTVWSFRSVVWQFGNFSGLERETFSVLWQIVCWPGSRVMLPVNCMSLGPWLLLSVAQRLQMPSVVVSCFFWDICRILGQWVPKGISWVPNLWFAAAQQISSEGCLISVRLFGHFICQPNSSSIVSKEQNIAIGWCHVRVSAVLSSYMSYKCHRCFMLYRPLWLFSHSSSCTSRKLAKRWRKLSGITHSLFEFPFRALVFSLFCFVLEERYR